MSEPNDEGPIPREIRALRARVAELEAELQDFEADQACEERCAALENACRLARKELAHWVKDHGQDIGTTEALFLINSLLKP